MNYITEGTHSDENALKVKSDKIKTKIDEKLLTAYIRIRENVKDGLAIVPIDRSSCGGCFNKIPPQSRLDIAMRKKIIICEHCGRILADALIADEVK